MDVRKKLVDLIAKAKEMYADDYTDHTEDEYIAETILDNFITVWDGKPIEAFLHPVDAYKGLKAKYLVFKADTGERVDNCFILRPNKDVAAVEALRAYAKATDNETLAKDIYNWVGNGVTVQEWISVKDRLPEDGETVLIWSGGCHVATIEKGITEEERRKMKSGELLDPEETGWTLSSGYFTTKRSRTYTRADVFGNNKVPYCWNGVNSPMNWFGQDVTHWMHLPSAPKSPAE